MDRLHLAKIYRYYIPIQNEFSLSIQDFQHQVEERPIYPSHLLPCVPRCIHKNLSYNFDLDGVNRGYPLNIMRFDLQSLV